MLLFLDVVSPIPEFFVIEDNKLIYNQKITKKPQDKLSDHIFQVYTKMEKKFNFSDNLKKIAITTGPGSYTSLRVGAAFISGLHISKKIVFYPFSNFLLFAISYLFPINVSIDRHKYIPSKYQLTW